MHQTKLDLVMADTPRFRHQEGCQSGDYPSHDEDWYAAYSQAEQIRDCGAHWTHLGHVEKTSDRDYEVEERYEAFD